MIIEHVSIKKITKAFARSIGAEAEVGQKIDPDAGPLGAPSVRVSISGPMGTIGLGSRSEVHDLRNFLARVLEESS